MCGILAILMKKQENEEKWIKKIDNLLAKMAHRGPDATKYEKLDSVIFGHQRLAILDLSDAGIQPMVSHDGRFVIIHNGEIYNYIEIRDELKKLGKEFTTDTDTEVILTGFSTYGFDFFSKIKGMFAFIIWDKEKEELIVIRDRFGIKPLYYSFIGDDLILSSEIKPIISLVKNLQFNEGIIFDYLVYSSLGLTNETFFKEIHNFPAGHYAVINKQAANSKKIEFKKYWDIKQEIRNIKANKEFRKRSVNQHTEKVKQLFFESVKLHLRSDVIVGSCLSGGIDSSSIVAVINEILKGNSRDNFETFSMVYDESFKDDEKKYSEIVTQKTSFSANQITPTIEKINSVFENFLWHQEEPVTGLSPIGQYFVMQLAKKCGTIVLLDGQGADEILAGYTSLRGNYFFELFRKLKWLRLVKELYSARKDCNVIRLFLMQFFPKFLRGKRKRKETQSFLADDFFAKNHDRKSPTLQYVRKSLNDALILEVGYNIPHLLQWEDRNSMAFSIETRVPFLDHNFVSYILALPSNYKIKNGLTKWIFREAMKDITPDEILHRRDKIGFVVPEQQWIYKGLEIIDELSNDTHKHMQRIYNITNINQLLVKKEKQLLTSDESNLLFRIACLNKWFKLFFK